MVLIKSTLASLPVHMLSLFVVPRCIAGEIEKIIRSFLWGSTLLKRKIHLVKWQDTCVPMEEGGLGFKEIVEINTALLSKWLWCIGNDDNKLWKRLIFAKYGRDATGWITKQPQGRHGVSLWKGIYKQLNFYKKYVSFSVGSGSSILFWKDVWRGVSSFQECFPNLFALSRRPDGTIADFKSVDGEGRAVWSLFLRRRLTDLEIEEASQMLNLLENGSMEGEVDRRYWHGKEIFTVKEATWVQVMTRSRERALGITNFPVRHIWKSQVPLKVCFFAWCLMRERILTQENLKRRGFELASRCVLCGEEEESIQHLFLQCHETRKVWEYFFGVLGIQWSRNCTMRDIFLKSCGVAMTAAGACYWETLIHGIVWAIWRERNLRIFEEKEEEMGQVICRVKEWIWRWNMSRSEVRGIRIEDIIFGFAKLVCRSA